MVEAAPGVCDIPPVATELADMFSSYRLIHRSREAMIVAGKQDPLLREAMDRIKLAVDVWKRAYEAGLPGDSPATARSLPPSAWGLST